MGDLARPSRASLGKFRSRQPKLAVFVFVFVFDK
jgi:hypothetical protein